MKRMLMTAIAGACLSTSLANAQSAPPVAGRLPLGTTTTEMEAVITGWSVKKDILGQTVNNDTNNKIGTVDDIIIAPDNVASFAIIGVGGFLGIDKRDVAIPMKQLHLRNGKLILPGASKDALKTLPKFERQAHK